MKVQFKVIRDNGDAILISEIRVTERFVWECDSYPIICEDGIHMLTGLKITPIIKYAPQLANEHIP